MAIVLNDGDLLEGETTTASKVTYVVSGLDGTTLKRLASGQLPNSKGTLYTAAGVDTIAGMTLYNTNSTPEVVKLYIQDGTASRQVLGIELAAGYHALFNGAELAVYDENGNEEVNQNALPHGSTHENAGDDEISVAGLSGLLADDQHVLDTEVTAVAVAKALYDAYSILMATTDDTPEAITIAAQQVVGRITGGAIKGLSVAELQALLFSLALTENVEIQLTAAPSADGKYSGITEAGTAGATLAFGDLVYFQTSDSRWELASADNAAAGCNFKLGICVLAAANDGSATKVLLFGKVNAATAFPTLTKGAPVYMSTTAGDVQVAAPTDTTDIVRVVGYGNSGDELFFFPDQTWIDLV